MKYGKFKNRSEIFRHSSDAVKLFYPTQIKDAVLEEELNAMMDILYGEN
ncbi:hypothetical protein AALB53_05315 [Lachnospiraceae bacterium 47-T17]